MWVTGYRKSPEPRSGLQWYPHCSLALLTFYDFPAAHWKHLRTTNPIESTFATVLHRTRQTKGHGGTLTVETEEDEGATFVITLF